MNFLAVSHVPIWPVRSGAANRRLMILEALAAVGNVDLFYIGEVGGWKEAVPVEGVVRKVREIRVDRDRPNALTRLAWLARPNQPLQVMGWGHRQPFAFFGDYDLIWYFRPITFELAGRAGRRVIVDLDDLEDAKLRQAASVPGRRLPLKQRLADRRNATAWRRYQNRIAREVDAVIVTNEADRAALHAGRRYVVPNGFPEVPVIPTSASSDRFLLVGLFRYGPNADAAEYFVREIFPLIRAARPRAVVRLVGRTSWRISRLAGDGVEIVGEVEDLSPEYSWASVAISPVRYGSGTRVKILEAFARGVPVVSTTAGAEGLDIEHGREILLADDPESFAENCIMLAGDSDARRALAVRARALYEERYGPRSVNAAVHHVLGAVGLNLQPIRGGHVYS